MTNFLSVDDVSDINALINKALYLKSNPLALANKGLGKRIGCIFMNPSMRTRLSTQIAAKNLGLEVIILNAGSEGWAFEFQNGAIMNGNTVEHIKDAARVLGSYFDILAVRAFPAFKDKEEDYSELVIRQFMKYSGKPIISLESSTLHPLQSFADAITIQENITENHKPKVVLTWAPHIKSIPHCVANSFAQWMTKWDKVDLTITHPVGYELSEQFTNGAIINHNQLDALKDADFVYVKNWSSFHDYGAVTCLDQNWMLTNEHLTVTNNAKVMHCLPVRRNIELSDEILDGDQSLVTKQAENRIWAAQAIISEILES